MKRHEAGFTLTELMIVVSIIGVLVTMAIVYMRPRVRPIDVATRVGDLVHEAGRRAVALGPVRSDVAIALGTKARTRILAAQTGTTVSFTLYRLQEAAVGVSTGVWQPVSTYTVDKNVLAFQFATGVVDQQTASPILTSWDAPADPSTAGFRVQCRPDGTCDAKTLFFCRPATPGSSTCDTTGPSYELKAKLAIMPLGGAITTRTDWN